MLYERRPNGQVTRHIHLGGRLVASVVGGVTTYQHTDHMGSPIRRTNTAGTRTGMTIYAPYGSVVAGTVGQGPGFTGHVNDTGSGLVYMQQRHYDPIAMRFVSADPVHVDTSTGSNFNRYWYANNNPYTFLDPDGREGRRAANFAMGLILNDDDYETWRAAESAAPGGSSAVGAADSGRGLRDGISAISSGASITAAVAATGTRIRGRSRQGGQQADSNREKSRNQGIPDSQIGPSGKPKIHVVDHGGKQGNAKEAARRDAGKSGRTVKHTSPREGKDHYHGVTRDDDKLRAHHEYNR